MSERATQERLPVIEELQRLHRRDDQPKPPIQRKRARVGQNGLDRGAVRQRGEQRGLDVQRDHVQAAATRSSVTRPVPAPMSSTGPPVLVASARQNGRSSP